MPRKFHTSLIANKAHTTALTPHAAVPYYTAAQVATMYKIPTPTTAPMVVGVVSFGGGLYGTVGANGVLTGGDVQAYWTSIGIPSVNHPKVVIVTIGGAQNLPNVNDGGSTAENTLDVETIGGCCPSPNLTIILYIAPNTLSSFATMFNYMLSTPVIVGSISYKPTIISCSWGLAELYYPASLLAQINGILQAATAAGVNICTATGDNGSNDGVGGTSKNTDFPSSSPYVTAVGGTNLVTPAPFAGYGPGTVETAWSSGGGAVSATFAKPSYQSALPGSFRSVPDIALVADPNTGVIFTVNGLQYVYGGTSVAAPIFAGFLAAIKATEFVNPKLYTAPLTCFHDVVSGSNGGYSASLGYDNCTGLGSIVGNLLAAVLVPPVTPVLATALVLSPATVSMAAGTTQQILASFTPTGVTNTGLTWTSSNTSVATISSTGLLTAVTAGSATVTATTQDGSNISASTAVTVTAAIPVTNVSVSPSTGSVYLNAPGNTLQLTATATNSSGSTPTNSALTWSTSNSNVSVSSSGLVTGLLIGTATVTARSVSDLAVSGSATITVSQPVTSVILNLSNPSVGVGQSVTLIATALPVNAGNRTVTWSSANLSVATVNSSGVVTGVSAGTSLISASANDGSGKFSTVTVTVTTSAVISVSSVALNASSINLRAGSTFQATVSFNPSNATNTAVTWSSQYPSYVSVTNRGLIRGLVSGQSSYVTVRSADGNRAASIFVRVR